jgi:hypothetical protein
MPNFCDAENQNFKQMVINEKHGEKKRERAEGFPGQTDGHLTMLSGVTPLSTKDERRRGTELRR